MSGSGFENLSAGHDKLASKKGELEKLANSKDGKAVQALLHGKEDSVQKALQDGNTDALRAIMNTLLQSESGKNIVTQLTELMK